MALYVPRQLPGFNQLLFKLIGANMNVTTDQTFVPIGPGAHGNYRISNVWVTNASTSLTTAAGGIYPAASKAGTAIVAAAQAYTAYTASTIGANLTLNNPGILAIAAPILSLTTPQGGAATADLYIFGEILDGV